MASSTSTAASLQLCTNPFPSASSSFSKNPLHHHHRNFTTIRASVDPDNSETEPAPPSEDPDSFENRLSQVRLKYKSGTGKKAEIRKGKKGGSSTSASSSGGSSVFLPPVPLKETKVDFGFSLYAERLNGRLAGLGLAALLLVELASGKSVIRYHTPAVVFLQVYFVVGVSAVFVKYEKERISIWPSSPPSPK